MGIINVTPDSFFKGSRTYEAYDISKRAEQLLKDGADMFDIGGYSTRPGAGDVPSEEEWKRVECGISAVRRVSAEIPISIDTFRADLAYKAVNDLGADIINDISGGTLDARMFSTVAQIQAPYIMGHMRGTPATMQQFTDYGDVTADVADCLSQALAALEASGVNDVIIDPGFGFSKTMEQNYAMLRNLPHFIKTLNRPLLVGVSRKSMLTKALDIDAGDALNATTAAHTIALLNGASILRVHDVEAACQARTIVLKTYPAN